MFSLIWIFHLQIFRFRFVSKTFTAGYRGEKPERWHSEQNTDVGPQFRNSETDLFLLLARYVPNVA